MFIIVVRNYLSHRIDSVLAVGQQKSRLALGNERPTVVDMLNLIGARPTGLNIIVVQCSQIIYYI